MIKKLSLLRSLFLIFLKISPITFGGGYVMISMLEEEIVTKRKWFDQEDVIDMFSVAQSIPGAVAINSAIFVGLRMARIPGAIVSLIGIMLPTLFFIVAISILLLILRDSQIIKAAFNGIGAAVTALIIQAAYTVGKTAIRDLYTIIFSIISLLVLILLPVNPIFVIIVGFSIGVIMYRGYQYQKEGGNVNK